MIKLYIENKNEDTIFLKFSIDKNMPEFPKKHMKLDSKGYSYGTVVITKDNCSNIAIRGEYMNFDTKINNTPIKLKIPLYSIVSVVREKYDFCIDMSNLCNDISTDYNQEPRVIRMKFTKD